MFVCGDNLSLVWFQSFLHVLCCIKFIVNDYCTCKHRLIYICFSGGWSLEKEKQKNLFSVHLITTKPWLKSFDGKPKMSFVHVWFSKPYLWLSTWPVLLDAHNASILWSLCIWKQLYFHWGDIMLVFTLIDIHSQCHEIQCLLGSIQGLLFMLQEVKLMTKRWRVMMRTVMTHGLHRRNSTLIQSWGTLSMQRSLEVLPPHSQENAFVSLV